MNEQIDSSSWLSGTWQRLTADPMPVVWRYGFALLGAGLAMWLNTFYTFRMPGNELRHILPRWGNSISSALLFGHMVAFVALFGSEYPTRLRDYWPRRVHIPATAILGFGLATLTWVFYTMLFLNITEPDWGLMILGGLGLGLGFVVSGIFKLPGWLAALITAIATYVPIYLAFDRFQAGDGAALLYYDKSGDVYSVAIPFVLLIALGGHAQALYRSVRNIASRSDVTRSPENNTVS
jgi:hypothetical protein